MEVHKILGKGHSEIIYGDALEYEFKRNSINYSRETQYNVIYKDIILPHYYFADFVVFDEMINNTQPFFDKINNNQILIYIKDKLKRNKELMARGVILAVIVLAISTLIV